MIPTLCAGIVGHAESKFKICVSCPLGILYHFLFLLLCINYQVKELNDQLEEEKLRQLEQVRSGQSSGGGAGDRGRAKENWSDLEIQTLIKAVNLFPAGTNAR